MFLFQSFYLRRKEKVLFYKAFQIYYGLLEGVKQSTQKYK